MSVDLNDAVRTMYAHGQTPQTISARFRVSIVIVWQILGIITDEQARRFSESAR